jgi:CubicO group peptidase (beta-lactamase class C family)
MSTVENLASQIDEFLQATYPPGKPGAAVIVVKQGQTLLRKGYGLANLELNVPVEPHMVFRLGSITKQFTATCILMLLEHGKIDLQAEITRYLPDYPMQGCRVTVEHLLTHTSGIKSYTELPEWLPLWRKDMLLGELIALFKDKPFDFEPGERFLYNNSGYILLGAIIEKLSGMPYADFVQQNIFNRLHMQHSLYDDPKRLVMGRASGYTKGASEYENAPYLSMTQPFAAGALASSVDDLALWDAALYTGELVRPETLEMAFQSGKLNNGEQTGYGYGWGIGSYEGYKFIEHGGGINGFSTGAVRVPDALVYVAVLTNLDTPEVGPAVIAFRLATMAIGKPWVEPAVIALSQTELESYTGVYQVNPQEQRLITREGSKLYSQRTNGIRLEIFPYAPDTFFLKNDPDYFVFTRDENGKINGMVAIRHGGPPEKAVRTNQPLPSERPSIILPTDRLPSYTGIYELAPGMQVTISLSEGQLFLHAPGQEKLALFAETPERLFTRTIDLALEYTFDASGNATGLVLHQGAQAYPCKRLG